MTIRHQHVLRFLCRARVSALPSMVTGTTHSNTVPSYSRVMDPDIALNCSLGLDVSHLPRCH